MTVGENDSSLEPKAPASPVKGVALGATIGAVVLSALVPNLFPAEALMSASMDRITDIHVLAGIMADFETLSEKAELEESQRLVLNRVQQLSKADRQNVYTALAMDNSANPTVRSQAISSLAAPQMIANAVANVQDKDPAVAQRVVENLAEHLTADAHEALLLIARNRDLSTAIRVRATAHLTAVGDLAELAANAAFEQAVATAALRRLGEQRRSSSGPTQGRRETFRTRFALQRIARDPAATESVRTAAIAVVAEPTALAEIAESEDVAISTRRAALERLAAFDDHTREDELIRVARNAQDNDVREAAVKALRDLPTLRYCAKRDSSEAVRKTARMRLAALGDGGDGVERAPETGSGDGGAAVAAGRPTAPVTGKVSRGRSKTRGSTTEGAGQSLLDKLRQRASQRQQSAASSSEADDVLQRMRQRARRHQQSTASSSEADDVLQRMRQRARERDKRW